ncbi:MAG: hypothetical protein ACYS9T_12270 [Planctomycetota bacterium]|jgi:hypothetical protein
MKRYLISIVSILVVLMATWVSFGQPERGEGRRSGGTRGRGGRRRMRREQRLKAIATIEEQIAKMKLSLKERPEGRKRWQELSDEEKNALRKEFRKMREERQQSIGVIEAQIAKLKGERQLRAKQQKFIGKLNAIRELAVKEKATETATGLEKLITEQRAEFEVRLEKLGFRPKPSGTKGKPKEPSVGKSATKPSKAKKGMTE